MCFFRRRDWLIVLGLCLMLIVLGYCQIVGGVCGIYHDDAIYVSTGKSLAEGQGYRLINLPDSPVQTKYPILYPSLLALIWKLWPAFPDNLVAMQWLTLIISAGAIGLAYLYLIRFHYFPRGVAVAACLLCITSPLFLFFCGLTLSEIPFALLFISALWFLDKQMTEPDDRWVFQFFLGVALALPFLCRTVGIIIVPIGLVLLFQNRRPWCLTALGAVLAILPWTLWMIIGPKWNDNGVASYYTNYLTWWSSFGMSQIAGLISMNLLFTLVYSAAIGLGVFNPVFYFPSQAWPFILIVGVLVFIDLIRDLLASRVLPCLLVGYLLLVLVWPWPPARFLVPILPFLLAYLLNVVWKLVKKISFVVRPKILATLTIVVLLAVNLSIVRQTVNISQTLHYPLVKPMKEPISWSSYEDLFSWIKANTEATEVIASGLDTMIYLYTGRRGFRPFVGNPISMFYWNNGPTLGTVDEMISLIQTYKANYFVQLPMPGFKEEEPLTEFIKQVQEKYPGWLKPVYIGKDNRFAVFKLP